MHNVFETAKGTHEEAEANIKKLAQVFTLIFEIYGEKLMEWGVEFESIRQSNERPLYKLDGGKRKEAKPRIS